MNGKHRRRLVRFGKIGSIDLCELATVNKDNNNLKVSKKI